MQSPTSYLVDPAENRREQVELGSQEKSKVLLFTVHNAVFPITTHVLLKVCSNIADVLRICILPRQAHNVVKALIEFRCVYDAAQVMESVGGADIYDNCCTLEVKFAGSSVKAPLEVEENSSETWDYRLEQSSTPPGFGGNEEAPPRRTLLSNESPPANFLPHGGGSRKRSRSPYRDHHEYQAKRIRQPLSSWQEYGFRGGRGMSRECPADGRRTDDGYGPYPTQQARRPDAADFGPYSMSRWVDGTPPGNVVMIYDLHPRMTPRTVFNLFCLYGDVLRVKFLISKQGCAMVEMADPSGMTRVLDILNGWEVFGIRLVIRTSRQPAVRGDADSGAFLANGAPAFADFTTSRNQRFSNPAVAKKNRIIAPSKVLHFFNVPSAVINTNEGMLDLLNREGAPKPLSVSFFPGSLERLINSGLIEFENVSDSVDALVICNNCVIQPEGESRHFSMKLCFSSYNKIPKPRPQQQDPSKKQD